jgi:hypothetical protein
MNMETRTLELVVEELADLPDVGLIEVLDTNILVSGLLGGTVQLS